MASDVPSRSQVKKAGSRIRRFLRGDATDLDVFNTAVDTMEAWRGAHYTPLVKANNGLRSRARTIGVTAEISQRLKRRQTILDKLRREPNLDLSRMQDIGGCRAVVGSLDELRRLEERIRKADSRSSGTPTTSRPQGYRATAESTSLSPTRSAPSRSSSAPM